MNGIWTSLVAFIIVLLGAISLFFMFVEPLKNDKAQLFAFLSISLSSAWNFVICLHSYFHAEERRCIPCKTKILFFSVTAQLGMVIAFYVITPFLSDEDVSTWWVSAFLLEVLHWVFSMFAFMEHMARVARRQADIYPLTLPSSAYGSS
jgi:hypothetical protein